MTAPRPPRPGEQAFAMPETFDAGLYFIGRISTPWKTRRDCPKNTADRRDITATITLDARYAPGLKDINRVSHIIVLYWLDQSDRNLIIQSPSHAPEPRGVFALRSPVRPNPIGLAVAELIGVDGPRLTIRNIDCIDGTPVIDIKPYYASIDSFPEAKRPE